MLCASHDPDGISIDENVNIKEAKKITDQYNITLMGNIPLTTTMLSGQQDNMKYVVDMLDNIDHHHNLIKPGLLICLQCAYGKHHIACVYVVKHTDEVREMVKTAKRSIHSVM